MDPISRNMLHFTYQSNQLLSIEDEQGQEVCPSKILINGIPSIYLKLFQSSVVPDERKEIKQGDFYQLTTKDWKWWNSAGGHQILNIHFLEKGGYWKKDYCLPSFLKILGLKFYIRESFDKDSIEYLDWENYSLFHGHYELEDEYTLNEAGVKEEDTLIIQFQMNQKPAHEQMGTGSSYESIESFNCYFHAMQKKIGLICQIVIPTNDPLQAEYGTGFLVGCGLIMTNQHVIGKERSDLNQCKAIFSSDQSQLKEDKIEVFLEEVIHQSLSPGDALSKEGELDFSLVSFQIKGLTLNQLIIIEELTNIAKACFKENEKGLDYKRANIIQYPLEGRIPLPKQIAFRENRIVEHPKTFELHYESRTMSGSSGSPVLNDKGELIGLHRSECMVIERELRRKNKELKKHLVSKGLIKGHQKLIIQYQENIEKVNWILSENERIVLRGNSLIRLFEEFEKELGCPRKAAFRFLQENGSKIKEAHIYCNTGVLATRIFDEITQTEVFDKINKSEIIKLKQLEDEKKKKKEETKEKVIGVLKNLGVFAGVAAFAYYCGPSLWHEIKNFPKRFS